MTEAVQSELQGALVNAYGISSAVEILRRTATSGTNGSGPVGSEELAL